MLKENKDLYHSTYSSAIQKALETVKSRGFEVDEDDFHNQVTTGIGRPKDGKTTKHSIQLKKNGKPIKKTLEIQVYNRGDSAKTPYELNHYIGESENKDSNMVNIKKLVEGNYADFILSVEKKLNEKAEAEYETEKMRVGLYMFNEGKFEVGYYLVRKNDNKIQTGPFESREDAAIELRDFDSQSRRILTIKHLTSDPKQTNESEQLDELSKKTLGNYVKKAADRMVHHDYMSNEYTSKEGREKHNKKYLKRRAGLIKATDKLASESISKEDSNDIVNHLKTLSVPKLKKMINDAFDEHTNLKRPVTNGWDAPKTNNRDELIDHIDEFCNNWNCTVDIKNNKIVKSKSLKESTAANGDEVYSVDVTVNKDNKVMKYFDNFNQYGKKIKFKVYQKQNVKPGEDKFKMLLVDGNKTYDLGSHPSLDGAKGFAKNNFGA